MAAVNVGDLEELARRFGTAAESDVATLDLSKLGYQKLLGEGKIRTALQIVVDEWSDSAEKKIQQSGGKLQSPQKSSV